MLQEIITYLIVGIAAVVVILKAKKKFRKKNQNSKITNEVTNGINEHNCSDCSAECILRDAPTPTTRNNKELCKKIEKASVSD